ncbi:MAG: hypothetical protein ABI595_08395 [Actinomycetota bacterium]
MFCSGCGSGALDGDRFCRTCGQSLAGPELQALKVVTASPRPTRARRRLLPIVLRVISVVGLVSSGVGTWSLLHADAAPGTQPSASSGPIAAEPSPTVSASPAASLASPVPTSPADEWASWPTCSNGALAYQIAYPPGWFAAESNDRLDCRFFDRSSFTVSTDSPLPAAAIRIYLSSNPFAKADRLYRRGPNSGVIRRSPTHVDGHRAFMFEAHTTTGGRAFAVIIDLGADALVIDTFSDYDHDFKTAMSYVMLMSGSISFPSGDAG